MPIALQIPEQHLPDLAAIRDAGPEKLQVAIDRIESLDHPMLAAAELREQLHDVFPPDRLADVTSQLMGLCQLTRDQRVTSSEIVEGITIGLRRMPAHAVWEEKEFERWSAVRESLARLLSLPNLVTIPQALRLTFDHANVLTQARVITDVRPVFDEDGGRVLGAVISQTLRVHYQSGSEARSISLAMDQDDVESLRRACERALRKARVARDMVQQTGRHVMVPGESKNGRDKRA